MRFCKETIELLKNFATISPGILITPGNTLKILGQNGKIVAIATIEETFDQQVSLYDLPQFLNVLLMLENPTIEFTGRYVLIKSGQTVVNYTYADPLGIARVPDEIKSPPIIESFVLKAEQLRSIRKALGVMGLPHFVIEGDGADVTIVGRDSEKSSSNYYTTNLGDTTKQFKATFSIEQLSHLDFDYLVEVTKGPTHFKALLDPNYSLRSLDYWIPCQPKFSKFSNV